MLAVYGERDHTIPVSDVLKFRAALEARDVSYEITVYPGIPHGWLNDTMPGRYRRDEAEQTWVQLLDYLERVLSGPARSDDTIRWSFTLGKSPDYDFSNTTRRIRPFAGVISGADRAPRRPFERNRSAGR